MIMLSALSPIAWLAHAALVVLLGRRVLTAGRNMAPRRADLMSAWGRAAEPWIATLACAAVVAETVRWLQATWQIGWDSQWGKTDAVIAVLQEGLPVQWSSVAAAVGAWSLLLGWRSWERAGRRALLLGAALGLGGGLGLATWGALTYLSSLPEIGATTPGVPLEVVAQAGGRFSLVMKAAAAVLVVSAGATGWALWRPPQAVAEAGGTYDDPHASKARWAVTLLVVVLGVGATAWLERIGTALAWENDHPIDPQFAFANISLSIPGPLGIPGKGPHGFGEGPVVVLGPSVRMDGLFASSIDDLFQQLRRKRELWLQRHPGTQPPGVLTVNAASLQSVGELEGGLVAAYEAGYPTIQLLLSEVQVQERPLLGRLQGKRDSALTIDVARHAGDCKESSGTPIHLTAVASRPLQPWLRELISDHDAATQPCLLLPPWHCPGGPSSCRDATGAGFRLLGQTTLGSRVEAVRLGQNASEYLVAFVPKGVSIEVLQLGAEHESLDDFDALERRYRRDERRIVWAMNGGMYHADRSPVGLLLVDGVERAPLNTDDGRGNFFLKPNGVFGITRDGPVVESSETWAIGHWPAPIAATQSGPLLLEDGDYHPALKPDSTHRAIRNAAGVIRDSETAVLAISNAAITFYELASLLRGLGCTDALYLDGNVSSLFAPKLERRDSGRGLGPIVVVSE